MKNLWVNIKYMFIDTIRDKAVVFWLLAFPILLSAFFFMAFKDLDNYDLTKINVGIEQSNPYYEILNFVDVLELKETSSDEVENLLKEKEIVAYIKDDGDLLIKDSGINVSIVKNIMDQIVQMREMRLPMERYDFEVVYTQDKTVDMTSVNYYMYTLVGMISIYGYYIAVSLFSLYQANISTLGARLSVSPLNKLTVVITSAFVSFIFSFMANALALVFIHLVLGVKIIVNLGPSILILLGASIFSVALGAVISTSNKMGPEMKSGLGTVITLTLAFLTGMMNPTIKHFIEDKLPVLAAYNPVNIVNDSLVSVNVLGLDTGDIAIPLLRLIALSLVLFVLSMIWIGRKTYDSI